VASTWRYKASGGGGAKLGEGFAELSGAEEDLAGGQLADDFVVADGGQGHARYAATLRAVGIAAKLAGNDPGLEVGAEGVSGLGEDALGRRAGRSEKLPDHGFEHVELGMELAKAQKVFDGLVALGQREDFGSHRPFLRGEEAHPNLRDLFARGPDVEEVGQITGALHHLAGNGAVDGNAMPGDVFQDAFVRGGSAASVVLGLKAVDGDHGLNARQTGPGGRKLTKGAGHDLHEDAHLVKTRNQEFELAVTHQRIAADNRKMHWAIAPNEGKNAVHQGVAFVVGELAESDARVQVRVFVGVAARAAQGTFARDLDGKIRPVALQDPAPGLNYFCVPHCSPSLGRAKYRPGRGSDHALG